jgi:hypothetical protein
METRTQAVRTLSCGPMQAGGATRAVRELDCAPTRAVALWDKFPEPRGWALQWDGAALAKAASARSNGAGGNVP